MFKIFLDLDEEIENLLFKDDSQGWVCSRCGYSSKYKTNVKLHAESRHIQSAGFRCSVCARIVQNRKALINHYARNHKKPQ